MTLLYGSHEIKDSREGRNAVFDQPLPCVYPVPFYLMITRLSPPLPGRYSITLSKQREPQGSVRPH